MGADPDRAEDRRAEDRGLEHGRDRDREAGDVGLDRVPELAPGRTAADAHLGHPDAGRQHRRRPRGGSRARTPRRSPGPRWPRPWPRVRPASTPRASGSQIGERSPARYGRKTRPSAPGGVAAASASSASVVIVAAEDAVAIPVERAPGRGHRRPDAVPAGQRRRRHERARDLDRPVPVDAEAAGRAARVVGVAGLEQAGPEVAREGVDRARRRPGRRPAGRARRPRSPVSSPTTVARRRRAVAAGRRGRRRRRRRAGSGHELVRDQRARPRPRSAGRRATPRSTGTSGSRRRPRARGARPRARPAARRAPSRGRRSRRPARPPRRVARVSSNVIAGRVASPRASTATSVGPWPSTPIATTSPRSGARSARTALDDRRPPRAGILLRPARAAATGRAGSRPGRARGAGRRASRGRP